MNRRNIMATRITQARFSTLKRDAKRLERRRPELSHAQALDQVAKEHGFVNWSLLAKATESIAPSGALPQVQRLESTLPLHSVILQGSIWSRNPAIREFWEESITTKYPAKRYASFQWTPKDFAFRGTERNKDLVRSKMATTKRAIAFMDASGLRTSQAFVRLLGRLRPDGFDHTSIWRDDLNRYIVTTEPYIPDLRSGRLGIWCSENGWSYSVLPKGHGIWNPCGEDCTPACTAHTQMVVLTPPKKAGDPSAIVAALSRP
jgi:hypothetical protein